MSLSVCVYLSVRVLCSTDLFFGVVGFTCVAMRAGLGPPSRCDVDLVRFNPSSSTSSSPSSIIQASMCAHTRPCRQILKCSQTYSRLQHTLVSRMPAHAHARNRVYFALMNAFCHGVKSQTYVLRCTHDIIEYPAITRRRHMQLSFCVKWKVDLMLI